MKKKMRDETVIDYRKWSSKSEPKAVVLLIHGMAEHIERYDDFANHLSESGYHVYGYDQRGHGKTAGMVENLGYFGDENGWENVVDDVDEMVAWIKSSNECPVVLFGHSMGSFIVRDYSRKKSDSIDGLIISGTGGSAGIQSKIIENIASFQVLLHGPKYRSKLIDRITGTTFMAKMKPKRTEFDWLSRDERIVDKYIDDPYCGTVFSTSFYRDLFSALERVNKRANISIRNDLPILIFSGENDPVGDYGNGVKKVYSIYDDISKDVSMKLYEGGRHEMLNEINNKTVYQDIVSWLDKRYYEEN